MRAKWYVSSFAEDAYGKTQDPSPDEGDGRVYVVRSILGEYLHDAPMGIGFSSWVNKKSLAKRFYDGQAAWGAASKSIYPAEVLVVRGKDAKRGSK